MRRPRRTARAEPRRLVCQPPLIARLPLTALVLAIALGGCGEEGLGELPSGGETTTSRERADAPDRATRRKAPRIRPARCPAGAANCSAAVGSVLYVESVDADGDGDLHVVATRISGDRVTGRGIVVFDVNKHLRPARDPRVGDLVTGSGPVYEGSFGQRQIEVDEFRVKRR